MVTGLKIPSILSDLESLASVVHVDLVFMIFTKGISIYIKVNCNLFQSLFEHTRFGAFVDCVCMIRTKIKKN